MVACWAESHSEREAAQASSMINGIEARCAATASLLSVLPAQAIELPLPFLLVGRARAVTSESWLCVTWRQAPLFSR